MLKKILLIVIILPFILSCGSKDVIDTDYTKKQEDFKQLITSLKRHPKTFTDIEYYNMIVEEKEKNLTDMSNYEFAQYIAPILGALDCTHTFMDYSSISSDSHNFIPLDVRVVNGEVFIISSKITKPIIKGSKILSINERPTNEILSRLYSCISSDGGNSSFKIKEINNNFSTNYYKYIESPETYKITYQEPGKDEEITRIIKSINYPPYTNNRQMNSLAVLKDYARLNIKTFNFYTKDELNIYYDQLDKYFDKLQKKDVKNLIIDFRGNYGGAPEAGNYLLSYILKEPYTYFSPGLASYFRLRVPTKIKENSFKGNIFVLMDGNCISTTGHVLSHIKEKNRAIFIGQESGSSYLCNSNGQVVILKNSGIKVFIPFTTFKTTAKSLPFGRGIEPDIEITYSLRDYLKNIDLEKEAVHSLLYN